MQVNSWHINYSTSICPFKSGKCGKEGKKSQKFEYLENKKSFLDEIKNIFHRLSFGEKIKIGQKIADTSFKCVSEGVFFSKLLEALISGYCI